jgi:7-carboxy-7-deazaguanine synthase
MFGNNKVERSINQRDGLDLRVVEGSPFYTIQGEGPHAGRPAVFLRLHGCPLRCFFCDTEFDQPLNPWLSVSTVVARILNEAPAHCKLLVVTGGEPLRQNLVHLFTAFVNRRWTIQIETSGILWQEAVDMQGVEVVVSPKTGKIDERIADKAVCFKYVIRAGDIAEDGLPCTNTQDPDGQPIRLARPSDYGLVKPIYLSPMDEYNEAKNAVNRQEVARLAMAHGYRAGLQVHKILNLP